MGHGSNILFAHKLTGQRQNLTGTNVAIRMSRFVLYLSVHFVPIMCYQQFLCIPQLEGREVI